jgi:hypothetical protein
MELRDLRQGQYARFQRRDSTGKAIPTQLDPQR